MEILFLKTKLKIVCSQLIHFYHHALRWYSDTCMCTLWDLQGILWQGRCGGLFHPISEPLFKSTHPSYDSMTLLFQFWHGQFLYWSFFVASTYNLVALAFERYVHFAFWVLNHNTKCKHVLDVTNFGLFCILLHNRFSGWAFVAKRQTWHSILWYLIEGSGLILQKGCADFDIKLCLLK